MLKLPGNFTWQTVSWGDTVLQVHQGVETVWAGCFLNPALKQASVTETPCWHIASNAPLLEMLLLETLSCPFPDTVENCTNSYVVELMSFVSHSENKILGWYYLVMPEMIHQRYYDSSCLIHQDVLLSMKLARPVRWKKRDEEPRLYEFPIIAKKKRDGIFLWLKPSYRSRHCFVVQKSGLITFAHFCILK